VFIQLVGSSPSSSDTQWHQLKNLTCTKGHIKTVISKHRKMLIAETKSADSQGNTKKKKTPCDITKWRSDIYTKYAKHIAQSTTQN